ncbi:MAG: hypothetical protein AAF266_12575 [Planctomycetota bacterium]
MTFQKAVFAAVASLAIATASVARTPVEIASQMGPHGTAPREWLQRLAEAGAGPARIVSTGGSSPRLEDLGTSPTGRPMVKVYAVLDRRGELLLPSGEGVERFRRSDRAKLKLYFERLESSGAAGVTESRGRYDLTEAQFTDLFARLQEPMPQFGAAMTLRQVIDQASRAARIDIKIASAVVPVLKQGADGAESVARLSVGTALAALLKQEGLALIGEPATPARLRVVELSEAKDPWPVGYEPEGSPTQTTPALMEFLTVEVEGYTLAEAMEAIGPNITWKDKPLPILWDRFAMRAAAIDPATIDVRFPRKRTFYKKLIDQLASQARLKADLRVDEAGTPFLWMTR